MEFITSFWNSLICITGMIAIGTCYIKDIVKKWQQNNQETTKMSQKSGRI